MSYKSVKDPWPWEKDAESREEYRKENLKNLLKYDTFYLVEKGDPNSRSGNHYWRMYAVRDGYVTDVTGSACAVGLSTVDIPGMGWALQTSNWGLSNEDIIRTGLEYALGKEPYSILVDRL